MMRKGLRSSCVVVAMAAATFVPTTAWSQTTPPPAQDQSRLEEAKSRYAKGLQLYDEGAWDAARVQFERAYELAPSYKILFNIGQVYRQLNEFTGSLKALEQYLAEGGAEITADRRTEVNKLIENIKGIIASANVTVNVPGAEVSVDDKVIGKSPLNRPVVLNPGRRKISAKLEGRLPDAKVVEVASGDKVSIELKLEESTRTIVRQESDLKPLVAWIVTGALAVGAGITGYLTLQASNQLDDKKQPVDTNGALADDLSEQRKTMKTFGLVTDILIVGTVVSAGVATYFTWFAPKSQATTTEEPPKAARVRFSPTLGGAALVGTF